MLMEYMLQVIIEDKLTLTDVRNNATPNKMHESPNMKIRCSVRLTAYISQSCVV